MSYDILTIPPFDRQLKRLLKKYPSLKKDFNDFLDELEWKQTLFREQNLVKTATKYA